MYITVEKCKFLVANDVSGRLGERCTGLGAQTLAPKNTSSFLVSVVFQQKIR